MATTTLVSLEEYHRTCYRPDVEYIDGELREKPLVQWTHSNLQALLCLWFGQHRREWGITAGVESRTQVSTTRVRLPDVVVDYAGSRPEVLIRPPLIVIEILSPSDTIMDTLRRVEDYQRMGVPNAWIIDPETRTGFVCRQASAPLSVTRFEVPMTPIYLDLTELFASFDEDNA